MRAPAFFIVRGSAHRATAGSELADAEAADLERQRVVLEADAARCGAVLQTWVLREQELVDRLAVQNDLQLLLLARDVEVVPHASGLRDVLRRRNPRDDAAGVVVVEPMAGTAAVRVVDLHLDAVSDRALRVPDVKVEPAVAALLDLVVELALEISILTLEPEVRAEAAPAFLTGTGCQGDHTVGVELPVSLGLPVSIEVASGERASSSSSGAPGLQMSPPPIWCSPNPMKGKTGAGGSGVARSTTPEEEKQTVILS